MSKKRVPLKAISLLVILIGIYAVFIRKGPPNDTVYERVSGVYELSFEQSGLDNKAIYGYVTGTINTCMGFRTLHSEVETVKYVGAGAALRFPPQENIETRYVVKEKISKNDISPLLTWPGLWPWKTSIEVVDNKSGNVMATKEIWQNNKKGTLAYDGTGGLIGSKTALFINTVLNPPLKPTSTTCTVWYPNTVFSYDKKPSNKVISRISLNRTFVDCPPNYKKAEWGNIKVSEVIYDLSMPIKQVFCTSEGTYIISWIYPEQLNVDFFNKLGELTSQFGTRVPLSLTHDGYLFTEVTDITEDGSTLSISRVYTNQRPTIDKDANADFEITYLINMDKSQGMYDGFKHNRHVN